MGLEMEMYTKVSIEDAVRRALVHKKTRKKTIPLKCDMLI